MKKFIGSVALLAAGLILTTTMVMGHHIASINGEANCDGYAVDVVANIGHNHKLTIQIDELGGATLTPVNGPVSGPVMDHAYGPFTGSAQMVKVTVTIRFPNGEIEDSQSATFGNEQSCEDDPTPTPTPAPTPIPSIPDTAM